MTEKKEVHDMHLLGHLVRFIVSALVLMFVSWLVPGFKVGGFWSAFFLALGHCCRGLDH